MKIKHTRGTTAPGGPTSYRITTECGHMFDVEKQMHKWVCDGATYSSLKEAKHMVEEFTGDEVIDDTRHTGEAPRLLWDTVCPCCYWIIDRPNYTDPLTPLEREMLDTYGLLLPDGTPDIEFANKEVCRATMKQLSEKSQQPE